MWVGGQARPGVCFVSSFISDSKACRSFGPQKSYRLPLLLQLPNHRHPSAAGSAAPYLGFFSHYRVRPAASQFDASGNLADQW